MAEERQDSSPLDSTANVAMQTAKTAKQAKQIADGVKSAKNAAKGAQAASSIATASSGGVAGSTIGTAVGMTKTEIASSYYSSLYNYHRSYSQNFY